MYLLIIINILGSIYGYYWYKNQLAATQFKYWIFVPDSPFSTTLFAISLIIIALINIESWLHGIAYLGVIKYGIWAVILITHFWLFSGDVRITEAMLLFSHLGMALEGFVYFRHFKVTKPRIIAIVIWFIIWDYVDYVLDLHPYLYDNGQWFLALISAVILSTVLAAWALVKYRFNKKYL
jgi:uncharacterized membrane protein YpjA